MKQPVPQVTEEDVRRIAVRDFGEPSLGRVLSALDEPGRQEWNGLDSPRVRLAILKLAGGDPQALARHTRTAIGDFRDVLAWAEYPRWSEEIGLEEVSHSREQQAIEADWQQYCQWLGREPDLEAEQADGGCQE
jgi:hypothetical protein